MTKTDTPAGGSILGNPVRRVEDPEILHGQARYFDDLASTAARTSCSCARRSRTPRDRVDRHQRGRGDARRASPSYTHDDPRARPGAGLRDAAAGVQPPAARTTAWCASSATSSRWSSAETRAQAVDAAETVIVDYDPLPAVVDPEAALADGAPILFPDHGSNVAIEFNFGDDPDAARRRRRRRARAVRQPAPRRGADGAERHPRRAAIRDGELDGHGADAGAARRARRASRPRSASSTTTCASSRPRSAAASAPRPARTAST